MAKTLEEWLATDVKKMERYPTDVMSSMVFFRDPTRPCPVDSDYFFAPADGLITYQKVVESGDSVIEAKGVNVTVKDLLQDEDWDMPALVIGTFMSFFDVHVNRIPFGGNLIYKLLEPIGTKNYPMLAVEKGIFEGKIRYRRMENYIKKNERMLNEIHVSSWGYKYYVVQIADEDVRAICPFTVLQNEAYGQNDRFSVVRWGSEVVLVMPILDTVEFETLHKIGTHVEAGLDPLVKLHYKETRMILDDE